MSPNFNARLQLNIPKFKKKLKINKIVFEFMAL